MSYALPQFSGAVRHSRMLLAVVRPCSPQAEFGLDRRLKHSGVTVLESRLFAEPLFYESKNAELVELV